MAETTELRGEKFCGVYIKDAHVALFANGEHHLDQAEWTIAGNAEVEHQLVNLSPGISYGIFRNGQILQRGQASVNGTVWFRDHPHVKATYKLQTNKIGEVGLAPPDLTSLKNRGAQVRLH